MVSSNLEGKVGRLKINMPGFLARQLPVVVFSVAAILSAGLATPPAAHAQDGPTIDVWYGLNQTFGLPGEPQIWCDIPGNVTDPDGVAALSYTLNGGAPIDLTIGTDGRRLVTPGDFVIDLLAADLLVGDNSIEISAVDGLSNPSTETVTLHYSAGNSWPATYSTDWGALVTDGDPMTPDPAILEQAHVVDGKWTVVGDSVRTVEPGYDRLIGLGELSWRDYEVTVPVTIHDIMNVSEFGVGIIFRWNGHTDNPDYCVQPLCGWLPLGDIGWLKDGRLNLWDSDRDSTFTVNLDTVYWLKMRVETNAQGALYSLKTWEDGQIEPDWFITDQKNDDYPMAGSLLLVAHYADVSFGNVSIVPIISPNDPPVANDVAVDAKFNMTSYIDILYNDTDVDGVINASSVNIVSLPSNGTITSIDPMTGIVEYMHGGNANPTDIFTYTVEDNDGAVSNEATVTLTIVSNQPPVANDDEAYVAFNSSNRIDTLVNDTDGDGIIDPTTVSVLDSPQNGFTSVNPLTGVVTYTHTAMTSEPDSFTYTVEDDSGELSNLAAVRLTVGPEPPEDFYSDDFNSCGVDPMWTFIDPQGDAPDPVISGAFTGDAQIAISVPGGGTHEPFDGYLGAPHVIQAVQDKDFTLDVKFSSPLPDSAYALQGVLIKEDDLNWLRVDFYSNGNNEVKLYATSPPASGVEFNEFVSIPGFSPLYMRIQRTGDSWDLDYSLDGVNWTDAVTFIYAMTVTGVGPFAGNAGGANAPPFTAFVDYFSNSVDPIIEPDDQDQNSLSVTVSGNGSVVKDPDNAVYSCGEPVQLTATADPDWVFAGWSGDLAGMDNPTTITMDRPSYVTANFSPLSGTVIMANTSGAPVISTGFPCAAGIPVEILRDSSEDIRGFTVTFQLTNLDLCNGVDSISESDYLSSISETSFNIIDNMDGSYDVDVTILGTPCGATALTGTLFTLDVTNTIPDGTGTIDVTNVQLRDCSNAPIEVTAGGPADIAIDTTPPTGVTDLAFNKVMTGNPAGNVTAVDVSWTPSVDPDAASVSVYHKGFGAYPEYSDGGGSAPALPTDPVAEGWELVATVPVGSSVTTDLAATRDYWFFCARAFDAAGNPSAAVMTDGVLNYLLGDVSDGGMPAEDGDNIVWTEDLTLLGAHYGTQDGDLLYMNNLDIGPSSDMSVDGLPTTDNVIEFEDLMLFGINYGTDAGAAAKILAFTSVPAPAPSNKMALHLQDLPEIGQTFQADLVMAGDGQIQGLKIPLVWDAGVVEPIAVQGGPLLTEQGGSSLTLTATPGVVDVCLAGIRESGISGIGGIASVTFKVLAAGDPLLQLADIDARDQANNPVPITTSAASPVGDGGDLPAVSALYPNYPNPFNPTTTIMFDLAAPGRVRIDIYSIDGRRVRTLVDDAYAAGRHFEVWNGRDHAGRSVASGTYLFTMEGPRIKQTRRMLLIK